MYGIKIWCVVIFLQFVGDVVPEDRVHHREVRQSGAQPVVPPNQNPGQGQGAGQGQGPDKPDVPEPPDHRGIPGMHNPEYPPDTRGTEFIFCFPSNVNNALPQGLQLLIGAGGPLYTTVTVWVPNHKFKFEIELNQGETTIVDVPPMASAFGNGHQNGTVWVRANRPVTVHGVSMQVKSHDGFLAIPVLGLGLEYFAASYAASGLDRSQITISGTQDFTRLQIQPIQRLKFQDRWFNIGDTILLTLNRMQTVQIQTEGDLTGTRIRADRPVSVMSGSTCSLVPQQLNRCDHLVENIPPVATWGKRFNVMPMRNRTGGHIIRVMCARPNTRFFALGQVFLLQRGGLFREFNQPVTFPMSIVADKPLLVVQYAKGGAMDRTGDPFMTIIPPVEQYVAGAATFNTFDQSGKDKFRSFASISVTSWNLFNMFINSEPLLSHKYISDARQQDWLKLLTFNAAYQHELTKGPNTIACPGPGSRFMAIAYGFTVGSSYAFPVVYGLRRLVCTPANAAEGDSEIDCTGPIVSGVVLSHVHDSGLGIQPPNEPLVPNQPLVPSQDAIPGWGNFNPDKTGWAEVGDGGADAGVFFPWYTIPPWLAVKWEEEQDNDEQECYTIELMVTAMFAPAFIVFQVMLIIICALHFRNPPGKTAF